MSPASGPSDAAPNFWDRHIMPPVSMGLRASGFSLTDCYSRYMPGTPRFMGWIEMGEARA